MLNRMRFYTNSKLTRTLTTAVWLVLLLVLVVFGRRSPWLIAISTLNGLLCVLRLWMSYWEITPELFVQHGMLFRRPILPDDLRYAGPERRPGWWSGGRVEVEAKGLDAPVYFNLADSRKLLRTLARYAPQAEIVVPETPLRKH